MPGIRELSPGVQQIIKFTTPFQVKVKPTANAIIIGLEKCKTQGESDVV
jgi:hypothetical protein